MDSERISRPSRTIKKPARYQHGTSSNAISAEIGENRDICDNPLPPPITQKPTRKRKRPTEIPVKPEASIAAIVPSSFSAEDAVIIGGGENISEVLETAVSTVASTTLEEYDGYNSDGKPAITQKRKARLKSKEQLEKEAKKEKKQLAQVEFIKNVKGADMVDFQPFSEGPQREPCVDLPPNLDLDSPYAIFSLFWTKEMWNILAENTNSYALRQGAIERDTGGLGVRLNFDRDDGSMNQRPWYATNPNELKVFIGAIIYMGLHLEGDRASYWNRNIFQGPKHTIALYITRERFDQLLRFLHISPDPKHSLPLPTGVELQAMNAEEKREANRIWWSKLEPLISIFRDNCQKFWKPGSNLAVDEMMIRFFGRSVHTTKMINKPIKQGYKMWAICERGYLFNFMFYSRFWKTIELDNHELLTTHQNVVFTLARSLPNLPTGQTYTIYMDNLFTNTVLFRELKKIGIGACGTTRASSSKDFPEILRELKDLYSQILPWGSLIAVPTDEVLCLGWIDNNVVFSLSTVHTVNKVADKIKRWRKRPQDTSTNARIARKAFDGKGSRAELEIPRYIDEYNFNMGGVDIADQHRQAYSTQRKSMRNWLPKCYWMIDHACINAFKIGVHAPGGHWGKKQHQAFRELLWQELFKFAEQSTESKQVAMLGDYRLQHSEVEHIYTKISAVKGTCAWYSHETRLARAKSRTPSPKKRCFGDEIDPNIPPSSIPSGRSKRTTYGCTKCGIFLCGWARPGERWQKSECWFRWHGLQRPAIS